MHTWFANLSLRKKILLLIYSCIFVVFSCISAVLLIASEQYMRDEVKNAYSVTVHQIAAAFDHLCSGSINMSIFFSIDPQVQMMFRDANEGKTVHMPDNAMRLMITYPDTLSVVFYDKDGNVIDYVATEGSYGPIDQTDNYPLNQILQGEKSYAWEFIEASSDAFMIRDNTSKLCLWHSIKDQNDYSVIGAVAITANIEGIGGMEEEEGEAVIWIRHKGEIIYEWGTDNLPKGWEESFTVAESEASGDTIFSVDGKQFGSVYEKAKEEDFLIGVAYPGKGFMMGGNNIFIFCLFALMVFLMLLVPILFFGITVLVRPIRRLTQFMLQSTQESFNTKEPLESQDEIGMMNRMFNHMVEENNRQIETIYLLELQERQAELDNLQSQINPHFLYNILDTIHWSALRNNNREIADMAYSLAQVFRLSLHRGERKIPLEDEKKLVEYYLQLQKMRYKDRLEFKLEFSQDTLELKVPKLLLQPLVENAVIHGIGNRSHTVHIHVAVWWKEGYLFLRVKDDGCGIKPEKLRCLLDDTITDTERDRKGSRYALRNIQQRLKLEYGEDYKFSIESEWGQGTRVTLIFPC